MAQNIASTGCPAPCPHSFAVKLDGEEFEFDNISSGSDDNNADCAEPQPLSIVIPDHTTATPDDYLQVRFSQHSLVANFVDTYVAQGHQNPPTWL